MLQDRKQITVKLPHTTNLEAIIIIKHNGQIKPKEGDDILILCTILLPFNEDDWFLNKELEFGARLKIADNYLFESWGRYRYYNNENLKGRYVEKEFTGNKWNEVEIKAEVWAVNEVQKLIDLLEERHNVLLNA